jgi:hypothetical protein
MRARSSKGRLEIQDSLELIVSFQAQMPIRGNVCGNESALKDAG